MKHTPGPWTIESEPMTRVDVVAHGDIVADCYAGGMIQWSECEANANLIAEAPAMLECLKRAAPLLDSMLNGSPEYINPEELDAVLTAIRGTLKRAEGS